MMPTVCKKPSCGDCLDDFHEYEFCSYCEMEIICRDCLRQANQVCRNNCVLCKGCRAFGTCNMCKSIFCVSCLNDDFEQCKLCQELLRRAHLLLWMRKDICKECVEFEYCYGCRKSFCKAHDRFVDCAKCKFCQIRARTHVQRCLCLKRSVSNIVLAETGGRLSGQRHLDLSEHRRAAARLIHVNSNC